MADETEKLRRTWMRRLGRPMVYWPWQRIQDYANGIRDGSKGLPYVDDDEPDQPYPQTSYVRQLKDAFDQAAAAEKIKLAARTRHLAESDVSRAVVEQLKAVADEKQKAFDAIPVEPPDDYLDHREPIEEKNGRSDEFSRRRRRDEWRRWRDQAEAELEAARSRYVEAGLGGHATRTWRDAESVAARARVRRLLAHCERRIDSYWRHVVATHPRKRLLNASLRMAGPTLPAWARDPDDPTSGKVT